MNTDEYYRRQAKEAEDEARRARNELDRQSWLGIARHWMNLVRGRRSEIHTKATTD